MASSISWGFPQPCYRDDTIILIATATRDSGRVYAHSATRRAENEKEKEKEKLGEEQRGGGLPPASVLD
jgi:hypothetical protein